MNKGHLTRYSSVTVTLYVRNWLENEASAEATVIVTASQAIELTFDKNIAWTMKADEYKDVYVRPDSGCPISNSLNYTWEVTRTEGDHATQDVELASSPLNPAKLTITPHQLTPGTYTILVSVLDTVNSISGNREFSVVVQLSPLKLMINSPSMTLYAAANSVLDVSDSYDPDNLPGDLAYSWSCSTQGVDCSNLIVDADTAAMQMSTRIYTCGLIAAVQSPTVSTTRGK